MTGTVFFLKHVSDQKPPGKLPALAFIKELSFENADVSATNELIDCVHWSLFHLCLHLRQQGKVSNCH